MHRLLDRTEGWAAGLQLAALQLQDRADPSAFIERFTGADWHIVNYLGEEVLTSQPPRLREFLLVTSVLNRMCAPLCNALTGRDDGAELISEVNRANLFLIPLDDERHWFRYHHLFGGLLRHELARTAPEQPPALHQRAAEWYESNGDPAEAITHAIASGNPALSKELITAHWRQHFNAGQLETVRRWLDALPAGAVAEDASLAAARVWVALDTGRLEQVGAALDDAESSVPPDTQLMVLRALHLYKAGDMAGAASGCGRSPRTPATHSSPRSTGSCTAPRRCGSGTWTAPGNWSPEAARRAEADGNRLAYIYAEGYLALMALMRGNVALAASLLRDAQSAVGRTLSDSHFVAMFPALAGARLAAQRGDWAAG